MSKTRKPTEALIENGINGIKLTDLDDSTIAATMLERNEAAKPGKPVTQPIVHSSTYKVSSVKEYQEIYDKGGYMYLRYNNATGEQAELAIKLLERAAGSLLFSCGMAAVTTALLGNLKNGDHIVCCNPLYSGTHDFVLNVLPRYGVEVTLINGTSIDEYRSAIRPNTRVLYGESPCNPLLTITDVAGLAKLGQELNSKGHKVVTMLDATFASPFLLKPIELGIDFSIHSATKYLGGHTDLCAGVVSTRTVEQWANLTVWRRTFGGILSPYDAYMVLRGIKTLPVRVTRQCETALKVALFLESHRVIEKVHYPGLGSHPQHDLAKKQMKMFGGMVAFEVKGGLEPAKRLVEGVNLIHLAVSLGGTETLVEHPATMSHGPMIMNDEDRREGSIADGLIRLSIGLEDANDLIRDLNQALETASE